MVAFARSLMIVGVVALLAGGCGVTRESGRREGEACTRTSECMNGLECRGGVCASVDAGRADGG
jgi:hypothetical protein